jgi:2,4-dienoyl-CoA reductase-like NADH-dependent reductase (Old Yellow Enzyme family)/thioredoxin reductase
MNQFAGLFTPLKVGSIYLRNRITAAPVGSLWRASESYWFDHLAEISKGGASLITLGSYCVDNNESLMIPEAPNFGVPSIINLTEALCAIRQYGAKASVELIHCGMWAKSGDKNYPPVGPVDRLRDEGKNADNAEVHGLTPDEMELIADKYAYSASKAKKLGFDMVMLHFAHGWLPAQFLSPYFNKRKDQFGGNFENRIRFPMMITERVRKAVGPNYPIEMRISGEEHIEGGFNIDECIEFVKRIQDKIDLIHVSSGIDKYFETTTYMITCALFPKMLNTHLSEAMKKSVNIPVVTVGGITTHQEMEYIISSGKADAVAVARALIADPQLPEKARTGRDEDITPCLRCVSCYHVATEHSSLGCAVNPDYNREARIKTDLHHAEKEKYVVIVGGGVAGMKAAITAADYGHKVTLIEKDASLGGIIRFTDHDPGKTEINSYKKYLIVQVEKRTNIDVRLNTEANPDMVRAMDPDFLVIAVGSEPFTPDIPGIDNPEVMNILEAYRQLENLPLRITIVGGGQSGIELALCLFAKGHKVTIIEMAQRLAPDANLIYQACLSQKLADTDITVMTNTKCNKVEGNTVYITLPDRSEGSVKSDCIVCAVGMKPRRELAESFIGSTYDTRLIGDCAGARRINEATFEGYFSVSKV